MGPSQPPRRRTVLTAAAGADTTTASARVAAQRSQAALADTLSARLGSAKGAGSDLCITGALMVTVTEPAAAPSVTAARCSAGFTTTGGVITPGHCTAGTPNWSVGGGDSTACRRSEPPVRPGVRTGT